MTDDDNDERDPEMQLARNIGPALTPDGEPSYEAKRVAADLGLRWGTTPDGEPGWVEI